MAERRPRPFVDTNVVFSGFNRPSGPPGIILRRHELGEIRIVVSGQVLEELERTIARRRPDLLSLVDSFFAAAPPEIAGEPEFEMVRRFARFINAADAPILAAAVQSGADCLVTGNTRHFTRRVARRAGIAILTPAAYLVSLASLESDVEPV